VDPDMRRKGVGAALVRAAEAWAREKGLREFASDTELANTASQRAHVALGFTEVERLVAFRKVL
jgi:aminoglycoside 6'-N-acetyltransferase I